MRGDDEDPTSRGQQPMEFFHGPQHIGDVLNHVDRPHAVERAVPKWIREAIQIAQHVGAAGGIPVNADRAAVFVNAAADVQDS